MDYHTMMQEHLKNNPPKFVHGYGQLTPVERLAIANQPRLRFTLPAQKSPPAFCGGQVPA